MAKRRNIKKRVQAKRAKVFREAKRGSLRTSAGKRPTSRKQTIAIALSEGRRLRKKLKQKRR